MRSIIALVVLALFFSSVVYADEFIKFGFDGRDWELDYQAQEGSTMIFEWVPKGQNVNNWDELVTAQAFRGMQTIMNPEKLMAAMRDQLGKMCPGLEWNVLSSSRFDTVYEWQIEYCPGHDPQYEVARIFLGKEGLYTLHYATKNNPIDPSVKQKWITILRSATLTDKFPSD